MRSLISAAGLAFAVTLSAVQPVAAVEFEASVKRERANLEPQMAVCKNADAKKCSEAFFDACGERHNWTTLAMVLCQSVLADYWDRELNAIYAQVMARAEGELANTVREAQRAWVKYRDTRCGTYKHFEGTMWRPVATGCIADMTRMRVRDLLEIQFAAPLKSLGSVGAAAFSWNRDGVVSMDLTCDGKPDTVFFGIHGRGQGATAAIGIADEATSTSDVKLVLTLSVDSSKQYGLCGRPIALETSPAEPGRCPVLRVDDGLCDAVFVSWDRKTSDWMLERN